MSNLDAFDRKILKALQENGRLTNNELGERIGLSPSVCSRRRSSLENLGVIRRYTAELDPAKLGIGIKSIISVSLSNHDERNAERFKTLLSGLPNVQEAYALTGEMDYSIKVVCKDLDALSQFINSTLLPHEAVANVKTTIVLDTLKSTSELPVS
ncbi:MAG: Lrp/AsnC family transcriptional regulator [Rhizobiaceae bacterium]|jgi:DNA-binding Lrp family transcriptional regulator|nr:Lrp/AsnC family transcriptional regulator [Rhizobiaceae bacterium]